MTEKDILTILKTDLQISVTAYDEYLKNIISFARTAIQKEGIKLDESSTEHGMLVESYAAYLYRKRKGENTSMPRSLRYALNNELMHQKGCDNIG